MPNPAPDLASLLNFLRERFPFTQERYPNGDLSTPEKVRTFAVRHSMTHMAKTTGKLAAEVERYEHGGTMDEIALRDATGKMLVNALKLAEELGMTPDELAGAVAHVVRMHT